MIVLCSAGMTVVCGFGIYVCMTRVVYWVRNQTW